MKFDLVTILAIAFGVVFAALATIFYFRHKSSKVMEGFESKGVLRMYTVDWCKFCKAFADEKKKVMDQASKLEYTVEDIDGDKASKDQLEADGVKGYPSIVFVTKDGKVHKYDSERTATKIVAWADKLVE